MTAISDDQMAALKVALVQGFVPHLPPLLQPSSVAAKNDEKNIARALAGFAVAKLCAIEPAEGAQSVVDDGNDFGIDAIYYHGPTETLYIVQAKLRTSPFLQDDALAFCQGLKKIIGQDFSGFNDNITRRQVELEDALSNCSHIVPVVIYAGSGLASHADMALSDCLNTEREEDDRVAFAVCKFGPDDIVAALREAQAYKQVDAKLTLRPWRSYDTPRQTYFGFIALRSGFKSFSLELSTINYPPPDDELWIKYLRTEQIDMIGLEHGSIDEQLPEDYVVNGLIDFDDVAYDENSDLLYDLAKQVVAHLNGYLSSEDTNRVLRLHQRQIASFVHAQMQRHYWEEAGIEYDVVVTRGFTALQPSAYTMPVDELPLDFRAPATKKNDIAKYLFAGFSKCLYAVQKFQSDTERQLSVILDRESIKWFRPSRGQFQIYYKLANETPEYLPDFVAETRKAIFMLEPKASNQMNDSEVVAKRDAAVQWCRHATDHARSYGGKTWTYVLIPHDAIADNMTLDGLVKLYAVS